jgi:hypothetical protein
MNQKVSNLNHSDIVSLLHDEFRKEGYTVSDIYEEIPKLPVDLICFKGKGSQLDYYFIFVASINKITEKFQKKLLFYQYYISLHYKRDQYKILLAVPATAEIITSPFYAEEDDEKKLDFYKECGFGLWKINNNHNIDKENYPAMCLEDKIKRDFEKIIAKNDPNLLKQTNNILPFVDRYIHDSVLGIANYYPPNFKERIIDGTLFEKAMTLDCIDYKNWLIEIINTHLSEKEDDDYDFCTKQFKTLWEKYLNEKYPDIHKKLEHLLRELFPKYRDHYIHLFQVFLLGTIIIDGLCQSGKIKKTDVDDILNSWMIAATFHDVTYPVQKHDEYIPYFFFESLGTPQKKQPLGLLDLKSIYVEYQFSSHLEHIIHSVAKYSNKKFSKGITIENLNLIREFFYFKITHDKNHALLSAIGILKKLETNKIDFQKILLPAATAIAIHDDDIWQPLLGLKKSDPKKENTRISKIRKIALLDRIDFNENMLAFLLILCDNIQDWGRHCDDEKREEDLKKANIRVKDIIIDSKNVIIQLYFNNWPSLNYMKYKPVELKKVKTLLKSPNLKFSIEYWDREKNQLTKYKYTIN